MQFQLAQPHKEIQMLLCPLTSSRDENGVGHTILIGIAEDHQIPKFCALFSYITIEKGFILQLAITSTAPCFTLDPSEIYFIC